MSRVAACRKEGQGGLTYMPTMEARLRKNRGPAWTKGNEMIAHVTLRKERGRLAEYLK